MKIYLICAAIHPFQKIIDTILIKLPIINDSIHICVLVESNQIDWFPQRRTYTKRIVFTNKSMRLNLE